jgi:hypothetical protein
MPEAIIPLDSKLYYEINTNIINDSKIYYISRTHLYNGKKNGKFVPVLEKLSTMP